MALYVLAGMIFDVATRGRVHPAYWWGAGIIALINLAIGPVGMSPPVQTYARWLAA